MSNEKVVYDIFVYANGIKRGCRKTDRHQFKLAENLETIPSELEMDAKGLVMRSMKTFARDIVVNVCKMRLKFDGDFTIKEYSPFSDTTTYKFSFNT